MASITLDNLVKEYKSRSGRIRALDHVSLSVADGTFVVLVGPSGGGKTTTLRLIAGLERPDGGTVRIGDRLMNRVSPRDRNVAMVFQDYALYPNMTVYQNLAFGLRMRGSPRLDIDRGVRSVAKQLGLAPLLGRRPQTLSGGEQQRVALGRAMAREPDVFLFDEPLSNLDATLRTQLRGELKALHQSLGTTMIHVTHDQEEAMSLGDRIAVMRNGTLEQFGTPLEVYKRPVNRFVAGFIGRPSMSMLPGNLRKEESELYFVSADGHRMKLPQAHSSSSGGPMPTEIMLGIRAEHVRVVDGTGSRDIGATEWPVTVSVVEPLGDRTYLHAVTDSGVSMVGRSDSNASVRPGTRIKFGIDAAGVHLFEAGTQGRALVNGTSL